MNGRDAAVRALGWLEGFSAWLWAAAGEKLADETAAEYDAHVDALRKELMGEECD